jgi:hypothetical protein
MIYAAPKSFNLVQYNGKIISIASVYVCKLATYN